MRWSGYSIYRCETTRFQWTKHILPSFFPRLSPQKSHDVSTFSLSIYYSFGDRSIYFVEINIFNMQSISSQFFLYIIHQNWVFHTFSCQKGVRIIHECARYTEEYSTSRYRKLSQNLTHVKQ